MLRTSRNDVMFMALDFAMDALSDNRIGDFHFWWDAAKLARPGYRDIAPDEPTGRVLPFLRFCPKEELRQRLRNTLVAPSRHVLVLANLPHYPWAVKVLF